ncbi:hypothetical protein KFK09_020011 [Dendrobium nobile]|uniref:Mannan endo-1,4-beta-mannosidase n=1 Tax=Dendrobium nobile TaxID=94219 RepID=A0A8T3ASL5_DENNO|nr:hypothetical protein KFK09_020011 [Dendrobium nobile]
MGSSRSRQALAFMFLYCLACPLSQSLVNGLRKVRGVNLGGWLVVERWIKPSLFDEIPNGDMLDGTQVQFKSVTLQKYVSAANGGGMNVTVDRDIPSWWETFKIWRVSENMFQFRCFGGQFLTSQSEGNVILATADIPTVSETYIVERNNTKVHIKLLSGNYLQATEDYQLKTDYDGEPGWDDNEATFEMVIYANNLHGDFQLANGYGQDKAREILMNHRHTFVTAEDFSFLSEHGINTVRIPVGWWIVQDPDPPAPFIGGTLAALDRAFSWAEVYNIRCIIDLHAAPGSQNGMEHSASRDGSVNWPSTEYITQSLDVIEFLSSRYADNPALLGIELLNEPSAAAVPIDILVSYYKSGYQIVRNYSSTAYVVVCQRIGNADPMEIYEAKIGDTNVVLDLHYYNLFDAYFVDLNPLQNMQFIYNNRVPQLQALNNANGPLVFIGEWVNEWNVTNASRREYQIFGSTQLEVYDTASFGWSYWTLKSEEKHWDFEWSIKNKYLVLNNSWKNGLSSCTTLAVTVWAIILAFYGSLLL